MLTQMLQVLKQLLFARIALPYSWNSQSLTAAGTYQATLHKCKWLRFDCNAYTEC